MGSTAYTLLYHHPAELFSTYQTFPSVGVTVLSVSMAVTRNTLTKEMMANNVDSVITTSTALQKTHTYQYIY